MKLIIPLLLLSVCTHAQRLYTTFGPGITNRYLSGELTVGATMKNVTASAGYIAMIDNSQPVLFNARIGYTITHRLHVYAGRVWHHKSNHYKNWNYKTWSIGAAYHFLHYDSGTFFVSGNYMPNFTTVSIGMSANLFKQ